MSKSWIFYSELFLNNNRTFWHVLLIHWNVWLKRKKAERKCLTVFGVYYFNMFRTFTCIVCKNVSTLWLFLSNFHEPPNWRLVWTIFARLELVPCSVCNNWELTVLYFMLTIHHIRSKIEYTFQVYQRKFVNIYYENNF